MISGKGGMREKSATGEIGETSGKSEIRSSTLRKPRTLPRLARPASLAKLSGWTNAGPAV